MMKLLWQNNNTKKRYNVELKCTQKLCRYRYAFSSYFAVGEWSMIDQLDPLFIHHLSIVFQCVLYTFCGTSANHSSGLQSYVATFPSPNDHECIVYTNRYVDNTCNLQASVYTYINVRIHSSLSQRYTAILQFLQLNTQKQFVVFHYSGSGDFMQLACVCIVCQVAISFRVQTRWNILFCNADERHTHTHTQPIEES